MNWNDTTYTSIVAKHKALENKPESVALAVWALSTNQNISPDDWREMSKQTGVKVAGRAIGSAREILGITSEKPAAGPKRGRGRPKGSKNKKPGRGPGRPRQSAAGTDPVGDLVSMLTSLKRERDQALSVIEKIRRALSD